MSERRSNEKPIYLLNIARFITTFSNRFFAAFFIMAIVYAILKKIMGFEDSGGTFYAIFTVCIFVTALWSYYILKLSAPLVHIRLNKYQKGNLVKSRIFVLGVLFFLRYVFREQIDKTSTSYLFPIDLILSIAVFSSFVTLIILIFKRTSYKKRKKDK